MARRAQAGIINPSPLQGRASFEFAPADFAGEQWGGAYWVVGDNVYGSSGGRLLYDLRMELGQTTTQNQWSVTLVRLLAERIRAMPAGQANGSNRTYEWDPAVVRNDIVGRETIRWAIWYCYHRVATAYIDAVRMPYSVPTVPHVGVTIASGAATAFYPNFDVSLPQYRGVFEPAAYDPVTGRYLDTGTTIDVTGSPQPQGPASDSSSGGDGWGALLGLAVAALVVGDS